jgi:hypothetical protein
MSTIKLELLLHRQTRSGRPTFSLVAVVDNRIRASVGLGVMDNGLIPDSKMGLLKQKLDSKFGMYQLCDVVVSSHARNELDTRDLEKFNKSLAE